MMMTMSLLQWLAQYLIAKEELEVKSRKKRKNSRLLKELVFH
jgi:hypothetical protein